MPTAKIDERLKEHSDRLDKIDIIVLELRLAVAAMEKVSKIVVGNGNNDIGLDEQARNNRARLDIHQTALDKISIRIDAMLVQLQPVVAFYKVGIWLASTIGGLVILLIWGILTHKVSFSIP